MSRCALVPLAALSFATLALTSSAHADRRVKPPKYVEGEPIPAGYHVEEKPRTALIVIGAVLAGIGSAFVLGGALETASHHGNVDLGASVAFVFGGLFLLPGIPVLVVGLSSTRTVLVRNDASVLLPAAVAGAPVVTLGFRF